MTLSLRSSRMTVSKCVNHGKVRWRVHCVDKRGKSVRRFFKTKLEATTYVDRVMAERDHLGDGWAQASHAQRLDMMAAWEIARSGGFRLYDAAEAYAKSLAGSAKTISLQSLADAALDEKTSAGRRPDSLNALRQTWTRFAADLQIPADQVTPEQVADWIYGAAGTPRGGWSPVRQKVALAQISTLFSWGLARGLVSSNPAASVTKPRVAWKAPEILTPAQARQLVATCQKVRPEYLPALGLMLYGGLRPGEVARMEWQHVRFDLGHVEVTAGTSKTWQRRLVTINGPLAVLLNCGGVLPSPPRWHIHLAEIRDAAGIPWGHDILRHSFCSYHLAHYQSPGKTALQAGHSEAVLARHYRELVTPATAAEFWSSLWKDEPLLPDRRLE